MLGEALVGTAEADITYVKSKADIAYVNATTDILLDYDSKNKEFFGDSGETVTLSDATALAVTISIVDAAYASDLRWGTYSGLLNGAPFNVHAILEDSSETIDPPFDDVTITIS